MQCGRIVVLNLLWPTYSLVCLSIFLYCIFFVFREHVCSELLKDIFPDATLHTHTAQYPGSPTVSLQPAQDSIHISGSGNFSNPSTHLSPLLAYREMHEAVGVAMNVFG